MYLSHIHIVTRIYYLSTFYMFPQKQIPSLRQVLADLKGARSVRELGSQDLTQVATNNAIIGRVELDDIVLYATGREYRPKLHGSFGGQ